MRVTVEYQGKETSLPPVSIEVQPYVTVEELMALYSGMHNQLDLTKVETYLEQHRLKSEIDLLSAGVREDAKLVVRDSASCCCALL